MANSLTLPPRRPTSRNGRYLQELIDPVQRHSMKNLRDAGGIRNADNSRSTTRSGSVQDPRLNGGAITVIPFVYEGREVPYEEAVQRAAASGEQWPAFDSEQAAESYSRSSSTMMRPLSDVARQMEREQQFSPIDLSMPNPNALSGRQAQQMSHQGPGYSAKAANVPPTWQQLRGAEEIALMDQYAHFNSLTPDEQYAFIQGRGTGALMPPTGAPVTAPKNIVDMVTQPGEEGPLEAVKMAATLPVMGSLTGNAFKAFNAGKPANFLKSMFDPTVPPSVISANAATRQTLPSANPAIAIRARQAAANVNMHAIPDADRFADDIADLANEPWREGTQTLHDMPRVVSSAATESSGRAGHYIGAPAGVDTAEDVMRIVNRYTDHMEEALDAGARPGYFYEKGRIANRALTVDPEHANRLAGAEAITSPQNKVFSNHQAAIEVDNQQSMGLYSKGRFDDQPAKIRKLYQLGELVSDPKTGLYTRGFLSPNGKAPNDQWEYQAMFEPFGGERRRLMNNQGQAMAPSSQTTHDFMHNVRQLALDELYRRRGIKLSALEGQELQWAYIKSVYEKKPGGVAKSVMDVVNEENISDLTPKVTLNIPYETAPGDLAEKGLQPHLGGMTPKQSASYNALMEGALTDPKGHDRLSQAFGQRLQARKIYGPGVYSKPGQPTQVSPGATVRVQAAAPGNVVKPESVDMAKADARMRALILGQEAQPANLLRPGSPINAFGVDTPLTPGKARKLSERVDVVWPPDPKDGSPIAITNTGADPTQSVGTFGLMKVGDAKGFNHKKASALIREVFGPDVDVAKLSQADMGGEFPGLYEIAPWGGKGKSPVTKWMLDAIDNPTTARDAQNLFKGTRLAERADAPEMREFMARVATVFAKMRDKGVAPNDKIELVVKTLAEKGLDAVRELVRTGAAPAVVLVPLLGSDEALQAAGLLEPPERNQTKRDRPKDSLSNNSLIGDERKNALRAR